MRNSRLRGAGALQDAVEFASGVVQPGADGAFVDFQDLGDVADGEVVDVPEQYGKAVFFSKGVDRVPEAGVGFRAQNRFFGGGGLLSQADKGLQHTLQVEPGFVFAQEAPAGIYGDGIQPGFEVAVWPVLVDFGDGCDERLLRGVFGVVRVSQDVEGQVLNLGVVLVDKDFDQLGFVHLPTLQQPIDVGRCVGHWQKITVL